MCWRRAAQSLLNSLICLIHLTLHNLDAYAAQERRPPDRFVGDGGARRAHPTNRAHGCAARVMVVASLCCLTYLHRDRQVHRTITPNTNARAIHSGWSPMRHAVTVDGDLNKKSGTRSWQVEVALPWSLLRQATGGRRVPPGSGDAWRINFSRWVDWLVWGLGRGKGCCLGFAFAAHQSR